VSVVGLGYVGLTTAVCFASSGIRVTGVEADAAKLASISKGRVPFHEPGLDAMLKRALKRGTLTCTADFGEAVEESSITFLTVGTPSRPEGSIDLGYLVSAASQVGEELGRATRFRSVVVKSTVVPGTTAGPVRAALEEHSGKLCGKGFGLAANPEFLREGSAVEDTLHPDAIVIGAVDAASRRALSALYRAYYRRLPPVISTSPSNAEFIKYAVNTFRATQLSFINSLANLCQAVPGSDVDEVARGFSSITGADARYLKAGLGFGGSCLPKDLRALIAHSKNAGVGPELLEAALMVNQRQPLVAMRIARGLLGGLSGKRVAVLGLAFKGNTDDVRESSAISLANGLVGEGAEVVVYDPEAAENARKVLVKEAKFASSARECVEGADCCMVATPWPEFSKLRAKDFGAMRKPLVVDCRGVLDLEALRKGGIQAVGIGLGPSYSAG